MYSKKQIAVHDSIAKNLNECYKNNNKKGFCVCLWFLYRCTASRFVIFYMFNDETCLGLSECTTFDNKWFRHYWYYSYKSTIC